MPPASEVVYQNAASCFAKTVGKCFASQENSQLSKEKVRELKQKKKVITESLFLICFLDKPVYFLKPRQQTD